MDDMTYWQMLDDERRQREFEQWLEELEEEKRVRLDEHLTLLEEELRNEYRRNLPQQQIAQG